VKLPQSAMAQKLCNWSRSSGVVIRRPITNFDELDEIYLLDEWKARAHIDRHRQSAMIAHPRRAPPVRH
jgi:quinol monooxygenase YgiN